MAGLSVFNTTILMANFIAKTGQRITKWSQTNTVQCEYYCFHGETLLHEYWKEKVKPKPEIVEITVEINGKKLSVDSAIELLKSLQKQ